MQIVSVDIGNSFTKFRSEIDSSSQRIPDSISNSTPIEIGRFQFLSRGEAAFWSVCSVNPKRAHELQRWIETHRPQDHFHLIRASDIEMPVDVESIEKLGRDRLVAAWQARQMHPGRPLVVIDAGTAVTIDAVNEQGVFQGGIIFPGAATMLKMLAEKTASLPDLSGEGLGDWLTQSMAATNSDSPEDLPFVGKSSRQAILLGIYQTQISTIERAVQWHRALLGGSTNVVWSGGGIAELIPWLSPLAKLNSMEIPDLVLQGCRALGKKITDHRLPRD